MRLQQNSLCAVFPSAPPPLSASRCVFSHMAFCVRHISESSVEVSTSKKLWANKNAIIIPRSKSFRAENLSEMSVCVSIYIIDMLYPFNKCVRAKSITSAQVLSNTVQCKSCLAHRIRSAGRHCKTCAPSNTNEILDDCWRNNVAQDACAKLLQLTGEAVNAIGVRVVRGVRFDNRPKPVALTGCFMYRRLDACRLCSHVFPVPY